MKNNLKATFVRQYRKAGTGRMVFVYAITGPADEVKAYETAQGDNLINDEDTGAPLMFTINPTPAKVNSVIITRAGQYRIDTSELDRAKALVEQYGGNFGDALATKLLAGINLNFSGSVTSVAEPVEGGGLANPK